MDDFATLQKTITSALLSTTRGASALAAEDLSFYRSLSPAVGTQLDAQNARLLGLAERLLGSANAHTETSVRRPAPPTSLREIEDLEANWGAVVDVVDSLLERADTALDEFTGAVRRLSPREQVRDENVIRVGSNGGLLLGEDAYETVEDLKNCDLSQESRFGETATSFRAGPDQCGN